MYLINRAKKIFGVTTDTYKRLSPIGIVRTWKSKNGGMNVEIAGVAAIDYMQLYKYYSPNKLEKYNGLSVKEVNPLNAKLTYFLNEKFDSPAKRWSRS